MFTTTSTSSISTTIQTTMKTNSNAGEMMFVKWSQLITGFILNPLVCTVGLVGNALCVLLMSQKKMRNSTNFYLIALSVADQVKLLNDLMYVPSLLSPRLFAMYYPTGYFLVQYSAAVSSWITVSVAFERFLMVLYPVSSRGYLTIQRACQVCVSVYLLLLVLSLPCAFRYKTVCHYILQITNNNTTQRIPCDQFNASSTNLASELDVEPTLLWKNENFRTTYSILQSLVRSIIPLVILLVLNIQIIISLHQTRANKRLQVRNRVTFLLIVVICCFIFLTTPDAIMSMLGWGYVEETGNWTKGFREIFDILLTINAAINFFLYMTFNSAFREAFWRLTCVAHLCPSRAVAANTCTGAGVTQLHPHSPKSAPRASTLEIGNYNLKPLSVPTPSPSPVAELELSPSAMIHQADCHQREESPGRYHESEQQPWRAQESCSSPLLLNCSTPSSSSTMTTVFTGPPHRPRSQYCL